MAATSSAGRLVVSAAGADVSIVAVSMLCIYSMGEIYG